MDSLNSAGSYPYYTSEIRNAILNRDFNERESHHLVMGHVIESIPVPGKPSEHHVIFEVSDEGTYKTQYKRFNGVHWVSANMNMKRFDELFDLKLASTK